MADLTTSETIDPLPVDETGEMVYDGWFVGGSTSTTKLAPNEVFENGEKYNFETYDKYDMDDNVINLYCTSSAAQYAITIHFKDDGETPAQLKGDYVEKKDRNTEYSYSPSDDANAAVPVKIEYNEETYVFDHFKGNNSGTLTEDVEFTAVYSVDSNKNGVPDKYEATVTYKVVNGTWSDGTSADKTATFAMRSFDSANNTWVETNPVPTLGEQGNTIPTNMKPATGYDAKSGSWGDNTPTENTDVENGAEYTYIFGSKLSYTLTVSYISDDGTALGKEDITQPINYGDSYDITDNGEDVYPQVISVGNDRYILEGPAEDSDPVSNESGVTGDVAITLVYTKDNWNDKEDTETGGDNIPDKYQALVKFAAKENGTVGIDGEKTTQVFTLKDTDGNNATNGSITPSNVTPVADSGYAFDIWTEGEGDSAVNPFTARKVNGGDTITFYANFAEDKIGGEEGGDKIPDKYQATVTYKIVGGTWSSGGNSDIQEVFTLKTKDSTTGQWVDASPPPQPG